MKTLKASTDSIKVQIKEVNDILTKSNLPSSDYVINPYIGCPHGCKYCYASFMKRFTKHDEEWGSFIDVKHCEREINIKKIEHHSVFLSSVTDCYNPFEETYKVTRGILEQLVDVDCELGISTKSSLILRDLDLLKRCKNLKVSMSLNTLDDNFRNDMDHASSVQERLNTLNILHDNGIHTVLFISPIFPGIGNVEELISCSEEFIDEYWFENLNLRGSYRKSILQYIEENHPSLVPLYHQIYVKKDGTYWEQLSKQIETICTSRKLTYTNYFYHEQLVKDKLADTHRHLSQ